MEPAASAFTPDQSILDTVSSFLKTAIDVYRIAAAIHRVDSSSESIASSRDLASCADALSSSIEQMAKLVQTKTNSTNDALRLVRPCLKIGQDLSVHLERARPSLSVPSATQLDAAKLCALWPHENVVALGSRLSELIQQWKELQSCYGYVTSPFFLVLTPLVANIQCHRER